MQQAAERMQILIKDLLTYAQTNKPDYDFRNMALRDIVHEVEAELNEELSLNGAVVECREMCNADTIHFQFKQLLNNLISNSIKFAKPNDPPFILIRSKMVQGIEIEEIPDNVPVYTSYCQFQISDNGIGFEQRHSEKIFEVFQRLHSQSQYPGTGIGLAIVKKIVDNHDGFIRANSSPGEGTSYDIFLPSHEGY